MALRLSLGQGYSSMTDMTKIDAMTDMTKIDAMTDMTRMDQATTTLGTPIRPPLVEYSRQGSGRV